MILLTLVLAKAISIAELPQVVQSDVEYGREMCRSLGLFFVLKKDFYETTDFNNDGKLDYVLDTRGFDCGRKAENLFNSRAGTPLYMYVSNKEGGLDKVLNAYIFEYEIKKDYGQVPYLDIWTRGEVGYQVVHQRYQWNGEKMVVIQQEIGSEVPQQLWKKFD